MTSTLDLLVIGAGPAGLAAAAHARANGLACLVLERSPHLADTVHRYQKRKLVMAEPALVPQRGELPFAAGPREEVLGGWEEFVAAAGLDVRFGEEVTAVEAGSGELAVRTRAGAYRAPKVILAIGTQGNPRRLGVPGEELPHVVDRLVDPDAHDDEDIVVVGAGDSALEVALALCERNRVSLVVRTAEIVRAKESLERELLARQAAGDVTVHFRTTVARIEPRAIELESPDGTLRVAADRVIKQIGAEPPRRLLEGWGVTFAGAARDARPVVDAHSQSSVPGLYLIGAVTGRDLIKLGMNQGYEVVEHLLGREVEPADEEILRQRLPFWRGTVRQRIATLRDEIPVFQGAGEEELREVFLLAQVKDFADGDEVLRQNDYTDSFLVIAEGGVEIRRRGEDGEVRSVAELTAGNFFGEMGLISGRRRNATAIARGATRLIDFPRKAMLKLLHIAPEVKRVVDRTFLLRSLQSYLLPEVPDATLWQLAAKARLERFERGRTVFEEGSIGDAFYLLRHGMVKLSKRSGDREIVLTYLVAGNYFGESALLTDDSPRSATVTTIFPTELIVLGRDDFNDFLAAHPEVRRKLLAKFEEKKIATLMAEGTPGAGRVLDELIASEAVIGTDVLIIDNHKCVRCGNCVAACQGVHDDGQSRLSLTGSKFLSLLLPNSCMQCENPLCMLDCPPDAIVRRTSGEIQIRDSCIGCGNCAANCPYDNIFMVHPEPRWSPFGWLRRLVGAGAVESEQQVAVKCDLCAELPGGPACVRSCPTGAAVRYGPGELRERIEDLVSRGGAG